MISKSRLIEIIKKSGMRECAKAWLKKGNPSTVIPEIEYLDNWLADKILAELKPDFEVEAIGVPGEMNLPQFDGKTVLISIKVVKREKE